MPSTLRKCDALGCYENALCCYGRCAAHCQTYCQTHRVDTYSAAPMPRRAPEGRHGYLGIEFEVVPRYGTSRSDMARIARHVCDDCSVRGDNGSGVECKVLAWCDRAPAVVTGWLQRLHAARGGCPITVNRSCGWHVHLDSRGVDRYRGETFTAALHSAADDWQRIVPPSRRSGAEYITWDRDAYDRSSWANIRSNTVELRLHPGTVSPWKAAAWLRVCGDLIHLVRGTDPIPSSLPTSWVGFGPASREYLDARRACGGVLSR